jgi:hypothetical protein
MIVAFSIPLQTAADWDSPWNPDPEVILNEARADAQAGRYEDALAKQLWFHHHALEHQPSLLGVRLSNALDSWHELGKMYPPALEKLKETRDNSVRHMLEDKDSVREAFHDMSSINEELGEEDRTVTIFVRLDKEFPEGAKEVYDLAQSALVKAKEFSLCGKYLESEKAYAWMVETYRLDLEFAEEEESLVRKRFEHEYAERTFMEDLATLIALLVLNERKPEAQKISESARSESKHPNRDAVIDAALQGKLPGEEAIGANKGDSHKN